MTQYVDADWRKLAVDPEVRMRAIEEFAVDVFGERAAAQRWLERVHQAIAEGRYPAGTACRTAEGFFQAMAELARISEFRRRETAKRQRIRETFGDAA